MITEEDYLEAKKIVDTYESEQLKHTTNERPLPYKWLKEEKWKIPQGATYHDPKVTLTQCAGWIMEYVKKYC